MIELRMEILDSISGGIQWTAPPICWANVIDVRGVDYGDYIDANGMCWAPGTPSSVMYRSSGGPDGDEG